MSQKNSSKPSSPLNNLLINIIAPVTILNFLSGRFGENGPLIALILALSLPVGYGLYEVIREGRINWFSALGVMNALLTGGLAVFHFSGIWFAVKEAAFPLVIGLAILGSEWTPNPLVRNLFFNEKILRVGLINQRLQARQSESAFLAHLKKSTFFLSCSFFLSAILNFIVAQRVFIELPQHLNAMEKSELLNQQISQMTWLGFVVIAAPSTILTFAILWYTIQGVRRLTGLSLEEILASVPEPESRPLDQDSGAKP